MGSSNLFSFAIFLGLLCGINALGSVGSYFDNFLDIDRDGALDSADLKVAICLLTSESKNCHFSDEQVRKVIQRLDNNNSGKIERTEFLSKFGMAHSEIGDPVEPGPQQIHLALTTDPTQMVVQWISRDKDEPATVQYGLKSGQYTDSATGTTFTYNAGVLGWTGWIHLVTLSNLKTNTRYYYRVGTSALWSSEFSFVTAPAPSDPGFSSNVYGVVADQGTYIPMGWAVVDQMVADHKSVPFSLLLHAGDVCYAGTGSDWEFEDVWDVWENMVQPLAANIPYMFAIGNHEHYYNWTAFNSRFKMPGAQSGGNGNFWYSIDYANVHFTFISTEHDFSQGSPQYKWIEADWIKANQNRKLRPWLIMLGHRPWYNTDTSEYEDHSVGGRIQKQLEPLMVKYGVDLYLCGHQHMFERIHPTVNGVVVDDGGSTHNVYHNPKSAASVVQATAGVFLDHEFVNPQPAWSAYRTSDWGYGRMTINQTHLHYEFLSEEDGSLNDSFWIIKS